MLFPIGLVPGRWQRAATKTERGNKSEVICSSMIARAFNLVGYPILPRVTLDDRGAAPSFWQRFLPRNRAIRARFRRSNPDLITPRSFDLSPYFEIIKFNHLGDARFSYRDIVWEQDESDDKVDTNMPMDGESAT
jgi:hypothetical protein